MTGRKQHDETQYGVRPPPASRKASVLYAESVEGYTPSLHMTSPLLCKRGLGTAERDRFA